MENKLSIITQNLDGKLNDINIKEYMEKYVADIYAFQELRRGRYNVTDFKVSRQCVYKVDDRENDKAKKLWDDAFPWMEFRSGYWMESNIKIGNEKVIIINFHSSCYYSSELRYILLKRLDGLQNENIILLGDFNAAFKYQTMKNIKENDNFLSIIIEKGFIELCASNENKNNPHYTHMHKGELKKLDHIFVSKCFNKKFKDYRIDYIDEVNRNFKKNTNISTDHSGIRLMLEFEYK